MVAELVKDGVVEKKQEKTNSRDHRLYVKSDNLLVSVPAELNCLLSSFVKLVNGVIHYGKYFDDHLEEWKIDNDYGNFMLNQFYFRPSMILTTTLAIYLHNSVFIWPKQIQNAEAFTKLVGSVFMKITSTFTEFNRTLSSAYHPPLITDKHFIEFDTTITITYLIDMITQYEKIGLKNEIEQVISSIWKIGRNILRYIFPEPEIFKWEFDYELDDWRKLVKLQKENPDQTDYNMVNMMTRGKRLMGQRKRKQSIAK